MLNSKNEDRDFVNASLISKTPIELFFCLIAVLILGFTVYTSFSLMNQNNPQTLNEVSTYAFPVLIVGILVTPFIVSFISSFFALTTIGIDIAFWASFRLTLRLQFGLTRQVGSNVGAQGSLAKLSNFRRLGSFVWVRKFSGEVTIAVRQDVRHDVNSMVDNDSLKEIADDIAEITGKTYTGFNNKMVNDKFIVNHYKKYKVAELS